MRTGDPWAFHLHPDVFLVTAAIVIFWIEALRRVGPRESPAGVAAPYVSGRQRWQFAGGAALLFVSAMWPVHDIAEDYLFSVHMSQHFVLSLIAVPLLLLGTPAWLLSWLIRPALPFFRWLVRPLPASLLYNGVIAVSHAAFYVNTTSSNELAHFLAHVLLVFASAVMWLPVCHQLPELRPMSAPVRMVYLFAQSLLPNVPSIFLAFADTPLYQWYADAPRIIAGMSAVEDQQLAGAIMKVGGTLLIWSVIVVQFFRWYRESEQNGDVLRWEDVERELAKSPAPTEPSTPTA